MSLATTDLSSSGPDRDAAGASVDHALREAFDSLGLEEGYDWSHLNEAPAGRLSIVVLRAEEVVTEELLFAAARSLDGHEWELFLAIESLADAPPIPVTMVNRYVLSPMPETSQRVKQLMNEVSPKLFAEYPAE